MTKKQVQKWLKEEGFNSAYSGNTKTMHVKNITQSRLDSFGLTAKFKLVADQ
jgi:hypothetical protein